ncbi:Lipoma-preferred partner [Tupaia chinensis]|uniref:Lipoma-preferred partner n=1 Tax=Tupaia chinensis TaxID=246437 RepID=L9JKS6_TUPCH|nr:Lipoma-preferred partner [Tupaia chinensis]
MPTSRSSLEYYKLACLFTSGVYFFSAGDFLPPPPPPLDDPSVLPPGSGSFPPPPPLDEGAFKVQGNPGGKTLEERRSSLDAEIDSLTSILADLECSTPYKPRPPQHCKIERFLEGLLDLMEARRSGWRTDSQLTGNSRPCHRVVLRDSAPLRAVDLGALQP